MFDFVWEQFIYILSQMQKKKKSKMIINVKVNLIKSKFVSIRFIVNIPIEKIVDTVIGDNIGVI